MIANLCIQRQLEAKYQDFENFESRKILRHYLVPEKTEGSNMIEFVKKQRRNWSLMVKHRLKERTEQLDQTKVLIRDPDQ